MNYSATWRHVLFGAVFFLAIELLWAAPDLDIRQPTIDSQGRFWVYRNGPTRPPMPFTPYGWMSDATNVTQLIRVDLDCRDHPFADSKSLSSPDGEQCIRVSVTWKDATWVSVAFISGPAKPPWWGENNRGRYFNLSGLTKKKLVFYARGEHGGESVQAQIAMLGDRPFGDSVRTPIMSDEFKLTQHWERHEIDLKDVSASDLGHICNGFGVIIQRASQTGTPDETRIYLDDIYFE